jgi:hypothetical protein
MSIAKKVAEAIVKSSNVAGRTIGYVGNETNGQRVENLLRERKYGAYIVDGNPSEWGGIGTLATIYMEQCGGDKDCFVPLSYYNENGEDGFIIADKASNIMNNCIWIEFINAAVACVYRCL